MLNFIESSAGRIAARLQSIGGGFDPEVLSLPGGSVIAVFLWLYASAMVGLHRTSRRPAVPIAVVPMPAAPRLAAPKAAALKPAPLAAAPIAACAGCLGHL